MSTSALEQAQAVVARSPFYQWLGLQIVTVGEDSIEATAIWQPDWMGGIERKQTHGGILASLIDFGAAWALAPRLGHAATCADLSVNYHRLALQGDLRVQGRVVQRGRQFAVCEAQVFNREDKLAACGRGTYLLAPEN